MPSVHPDPEELCGAEGEGQSGPVSGAQATEDRVQRAEEAQARAMDDLHKLKLVQFSVICFNLFDFITFTLHLADAFGLSKVTYNKYIC